MTISHYFTVTSYIILFCFCLECGAQFSLALTKSGNIWTWGKGDYFRLGHGTDQHVRKPTLIESLRDRKIIHVAVGALHCLAVTDTGQVGLHNRFTLLYKHVENASYSYYTRWI